MLVEPEGVLFLGDIDPGQFGSHYGDAGFDPGGLKRSLRAVPQIPAGVWVLFHATGGIENAAAFAAVDRFRARIAWWEWAPRGFLAGPRTLEEMVAGGFFYPPWVHGPLAEVVERRAIAQHLLRWRREGRVRQCEGEQCVRI